MGRLFNYGVVLFTVSLLLAFTQIHHDVFAKDNNLLTNGGFEHTHAQKGWDKGVGPTNWSLWTPKGHPSVAIDQNVVYKGNQAIKINADEVSRADISQEISVQPGTTYRLAYWLKTKNVKATWGGLRVRVQYFDTGGSKVKDNTISDDITGTHDWMKKKIKIGIPEKVQSIKVELFFETATGRAWFDNVTLVKLDERSVTDFELKEDTLILDKGEENTLTPIFTPENAANKKITWETSAPDIAIVDQEGIVTGKDYGTALITAKTNDGGFTAETLVSVEPSGSKPYQALQTKWVYKLIGNLEDVTLDKTMKKSINQIVTNVKNNDKTGFWDQMNTSTNRSYLWKDLKKTTISANITSAYRRLETMAQAYTIKGSTLYHDEQLKKAITDGLEWMFVQRYNGEKNEYDNWWDWEIGVPKALENTIILMNHVLGAQSIKNYTSAIHHFVLDPTKRTINGVTETGANRLDKSLIVTLEGIINQNSKRILEGRNALSQVLLYVNNGDGMYKDGSFIQHTDVAYTGGYGSVLLSDLANMLYLLKDSPWDITDPHLNNVYEWTENAFEPLIYKGAMMDMVSGRGITREGESDRTRGRAIVRSLLELAQGASTENAKEINQMVKYWIQEDTSFDDYLEELPIYDIVLIKKLLADDTIKPRGTYNVNHVFPAMARAVHHHDEYAYGISMFSKKISAFEYGNGENKKGWYSGVGMTTLYNDDLNQFADDFWPTINPLRLPGTTTDHTTGKLVGWGSYLNTENWVGGVSLDGLYGTVGMDFTLGKVTGSPLAGKKSWFMFDDEIVALGSGITNTNGKDTETIIENRKINQHGDNQLIVNGQEKSKKIGWSQTLDNVQWAHIEGNTKHSSIGYYFPNKGMIKGLREKRSGSWNAINDGGSATPVIGNYVSLAFDHGVNPTNASYAYVLLPNKSVTDTKKYSKHPNIDVIANTKHIAAVREKKLGIIAANFFDSGSVGPLTSSQPASVMLRDDGGVLTLAVANPTEKQKSVVVEIKEKADKVLEKSDAITVLQTSPTIKVRVNVSTADGDTYMATFAKMMVDLSDLQDIIQNGLKKQDIQDTFANNLLYRIQVIRELQKQDNKKQAKAYLVDLYKYINDPSVQAQGLVTKKVTNQLNQCIKKLQQ